MGSRPAGIREIPTYPDYLWGIGGLGAVLAVVLCNTAYHLSRLHA